MARHEAIHGLPRCARNDGVACSITHMDCRVAAVIARHEAINGLPRFARNDEEWRLTRKSAASFKLPAWR